VSRSSTHEERLAPLAKQAKSIWAMLRQESNVDLGAIRLAGSSTQRHVELDVSVDGAPGSALGVMSQGEVNALALAVFLSRARLPALSRACHYHPYELAPTATELTRWLHETTDLVALLRSRSDP
jgi:hypothetical protein